MTRINNLTDEQFANIMVAVVEQARLDSQSKDKALADEAKHYLERLQKDFAR